MKTSWIRCAELFLISFALLATSSKAAGWQFDGRVSGRKPSGEVVEGRKHRLEIQTARPQPGIAGGGSAASLRYFRTLGIDLLVRGRR